MLNILLIDDEPHLTCDILDAYGYTVEVSTDGQMGLEKLYSNFNRYDLVILDVRMPKMNGWEVLKSIRHDEKHSQIPIIMLTSCKDSKSIVKGLRRGADYYLPKPIELGVLTAHLEALDRRIQWIEEKTEKFIPRVSTLKKLTHREEEVLTCIAKGYSNQKISEELYIAKVTVKNHVVNILRKLNATNRTHAALLFNQLSVFKA